MAIALLGPPASALADGPADEIAEGRRLQASLDYDRALAVVEQAIAHGGAAPGRLADLHVLAGELAAGLDRAAAAEDHFARALALRPATALPAGTSPRLTGPFAAARARGVPALQVSATVQQGLVTLAVGADPLGLVVGISVHTVDSHGAHAEVSERAALRVVVAPGGSVVEVAALDAVGNRVWVSAPSTASPAPSPRPPPPPSPRARHASAIPWAVATGVVLAGAAACGWRERVAQDDWNTLRATNAPSFRALTVLEDRGRHWAFAADLGIGVAAATGVAAAILWWRGRGDAAFAPLVTPSGGGLVYGGEL